ncbi:transcriptional activator [Sporothrix schenckii 1099-18]|uniref:Transcriptional activator n=1 Tax=Sporothrix schenckii 1099-18 TaxID=1397361 RepID=A0A0F2M6Z9_SPOSC|nr:transcriptional activator [Sporothrix schenckii 1099-18]KJR85473.1 transcriptional activator [Sporothrix schenckii 1099-18]
MSGNDTGRAGVVTAPTDGNGMDKLASAILDDLLYNVIHDLIMKTHRDEKQARAATAAIRVETLAAEAAQDLAGATGESKSEGHHETDAALYESGQVTLKANPLKTTTDILCPRCHLPRLLYPTDGRGAHKPDPNVTYCKKHPYIDKPGCDIYGQMWVAPGPGRGKKKKDFDKKVSAAIHAATTGFDGDDGKPGSANGTGEQRPPNVLSFPSATCSKCKRCILVSRLNNHMGSCIGNSGRNASRAAAAKISNGGNGATDNTPPSSQKGTPMPSSQGSPRKRDADDFDDDNGGGNYDESDMAGGSGSQSTAKPKKKFKSSASVSAAASQAGGSGSATPSVSSSQGLSAALNKKLTLKMKNAPGSPAPAGSAAGPVKKQKAKPSSALSFERKIDDNYDDDDDDEDDGDDGDNGDNGDHDRDYVDDDDFGRGRLSGDDDDDDDDDVRRSFKPNGHGGRSNGATMGAFSLGANGKLKKKKKLVEGPPSASSTPTSSPPKKTTKVPVPPIPGNKKVKLVGGGSLGSGINSKATPLSPPASKNGSGGGVRDLDAGSESSGTMSSPRG